MIIGTTNNLLPLEVGDFCEVYDLVRDEPYDGVFVVRRKATYEEYIAEHVARNRPTEPPCDPSEAQFYEVSLD
jgi:hypothetical protein